ncbi:AAA family ATPase [uncultured Sphingomonas sp.]|uniref:AAA family ATPase n=1 Tax=uncultured Sphingomonas sp. TaxID=158754 RepID=UPI00374832A8
MLRVEEPDGAGGRLDYMLDSPAKAVVEVKREAKLWSLPPSGRPRAVRKIAPLLSNCPNFREVVEQVIPYCALKGAPIAIVTNGPQLAIFQAYGAGLRPLEGEAYVFDGFDAQLENFSLLWSLLSPEGISENRALRQLGLHRSPRIPIKASQAIPEPMKFRYRDNLQDELRQIGSLLLEEIEDNPALRSEFFKECYVPIEANNRHLLLSKQIISERYSRVSGDSSTPSALDAASRTGKLGDNFLRNAGSRPMVVIGDVGVGKSSFFENLYLNLNKEKDNIFININLGDKANLAEDLRRFISDAIPASLYSNYSIDIFSADFIKAIYDDELKRFDKGIFGELKNTDPGLYESERRKFLAAKLERSDAHLLASLAHISRGQNRRVILVIDNADQRTFETQQEAFLIAQELAASRSMFVFVALRPSTFYLSKTTGALSAYQNKILSISPPPADEVIQRRLTFALRIAEGKVAPAALEGIRLNLSSVVAFLRATLRSVIANNKIRQFLSNITGGNTRAVIELVTSFCGSPNVDARKIVNIELEQGDYIVPLHEFTKHALLGEYSYYNPLSSIVACNVFDVVSADPREHFLACLIISYLSSNIGNRDKDGFVPGEGVRTEMSRHSYLEDQIDGALRKLAKHKLIETPHSHYREVAVDDDVSPRQFHYRATSVGIYHVRFWIGSFSFLDATSTDTPIFDDTKRKAIVDLASSFDINDRLRKTSAFRQYLEECWTESNLACNYFNLPEIFASQRDEFTSVERASRVGSGPHRRTGRRPQSRRTRI